MSNPNFAILRSTKIKTVQKLAAASLHNTRKLDVPNASSHAGEVTLIAGSQNAYERHIEMMNKCNIKPRKNAVLAIEHVCTFSPESEVADLDSWVEANLKFIENKYGDRGKILQCVLHTDETTPHLHILVSPLEKQNVIDKRIKDPEKIKNFKPFWKLNCRAYLGGKDKMIAMQDEYADAMKQFGLERGIRNSKAKHQTINKFYSELNADVKSAEKELTDILENKPSLFNISKFAQQVKDKLMQLTKQAMKLERQEKQVRRRESRANKLMDRIDDICRVFKCKDPDNLPQKINEHIENEVKRETRDLKERLDNATSWNADNALKIRKHDDIIKAKDREIKELNNKNMILKRKVRTNEQENAL